MAQKLGMSDVENFGDSTGDLSLSSPSLSTIPAR
jgi:hypothetical protein